METKEGMTSRSPRPSAMTNGTDTRMLLQHVSERYFTETVERISGRRVPAFVTGTDTHRDVSSEVFYLEPVAGAEARGG